MKNEKNKDCFFQSNSHHHCRSANGLRKLGVLLQTLNIYSHLHCNPNLGVEVPARDISYDMYQNSRLDELRSGHSILLLLGSLSATLKKCNQAA